MENNPLIEIGLPVSLFIIMIGIGLTLTMGDFAREAKQPRSVLVGSFGQLFVVPLLGFAVAWALGFPAAMAVGMVTIAACPGGATSNVIAYLARSNVALSIIVTAIASLATIVTLPLFVKGALQWQLGATAEVQMPVLQTVLLLVVIVLIPVIIGMLIRARAPEYALRLEKPLNLFGALVLLALIVFISWSLRDRIGTLLAQAGLACLLLNLLSMTAAWLLGRITNLPPRDRLTLCIELGIKNSTIGILLATTILDSAEMAVPAMVYGLLMYATGAGLVAWGRRENAA